MKILQAQVKSAEFARNVHHVTIEHGGTLADTLDPKSWAHVARGFRAGDRIEVVPESGEWFAELFVRSRTDNDVKVAVLRHVEFDMPLAPVEAPAPALAPATPAEFEIVFSKAEKWRVVRKSDNAILANGLANRGEAEAWLDSNILSLV